MAGMMKSSPNSLPSRRGKSPSRKDQDWDWNFWTTSKKENQPFQGRATKLVEFLLDSIKTIIFREELPMRK